MTRRELMGSFVSILFAGQREQPTSFPICRSYGDVSAFVAIPPHIVYSIELVGDTFHLSATPADSWASGELTLSLDV